MEIVTLSVGELQTNCYLVYNKDSRETVIVDPGDEATFITDEILRLKLTPTAIIATHGHFDHILASWELQQNFNLPFYIHPKDNFLLDRMQSSAKHWLDREIVEQISENLLDVMSLVPVSHARRRLAGTTRRRLAEPTEPTIPRTLEVVKTPGHTPGSICLIFPKEKIIFTGDTLFADGMVGETTHHYSSKRDLQNSVTEIKKKYRNFLAYPGHGESFII